MPTLTIVVPVPDETIETFNAHADAGATLTVGPLTLDAAAVAAGLGFLDAYNAGLEAALKPVVAGMIERATADVVRQANEFVERERNLAAAARRDADAQSEKMQAMLHETLELNARARARANGATPAEPSKLQKENERLAVELARANGERDALKAQVERFAALPAPTSAPTSVIVTIDRAAFEKAFKLELPPTTEVVEIQRDDAGLMTRAVKTVRPAAAIA